MKIQKSWMAACLIAACAVNAQAQNSYAEIAFQTIDMGLKSNASAIRGVLGTQLNDWMDVEGMIGVGVQEAQSDDSFISDVVVKSKINIDRYAGVYAKPKFKIGNAIELFGRVGYASTLFTAKASGQRGNRFVYSERSGSESGLSYGLGASYALTQSFILSADYMSMAEDLDAMSVGIRYAF
jgi:opacity protein-like surface antigen